ncbi:MAG: AAA family ATPase [Ruminococcus sp.]
MNKTKFNEFTENKIKEIFSNIENTNRFILLRGPIGVGKTLIAKELSKRIVNKNSDNNDFNKYISIVPFHPGSDYENVIYGLKLTTDNGNMKYNATERILLNAISKAKNDKDNNYVVILDDVNRGNFAKAMGDVLNAVESKDAGNAIRPRDNLSYKIPDNFYLIATFNPTISNPNIDYAWLRRFMIFDIFSDERYIENVNKIIERNKCEKFFNETPEDKFTDYIFELYMQIKILFERYFLDDDINIIKQYMPGHGLYMTYDDNKDYAKNAKKFSYQLKHCIVPLLYQYVKDGLLDKRALIDIKAYEHLYDEDFICFNEREKNGDIRNLSSVESKNKGENTTSKKQVYELMNALINFEHMPQAASFKFFFQNVSMMSNFKTYLFETEDIKNDRNNRITGFLATKDPIKIMNIEFYLPGLLSKNATKTLPKPYSALIGKTASNGQTSPDLVYQLLIKWFLRAYEFNCCVNERDYNELEIITELHNNNNIINKKSDILKEDLQEIEKKIKPQSKAEKEWKVNTRKGTKPGSP